MARCVKRKCKLNWWRRRSDREREWRRKDWGRKAQRVQPHKKNKETKGEKGQAEAEVIARSKKDEDAQDGNANGT